MSFFFCEIADIIIHGSKERTEHGGVIMSKENGKVVFIPCGDSMEIMSEIMGEENSAAESLSAGCIMDSSNTEKEGADSTAV